MNPREVARAAFILRSRQAAADRLGMTLDEVNAILDEAVAAMPTLPLVEPVTVNSRLLIEQQDEIRTLTAQFEFDAIYVFGSTALGRDNQSDIDILVMGGEPNKSFPFSRALNALLNVPIDISHAEWVTDFPVWSAMLHLRRIF